MTVDRVVTLPGSINFRDFGGYETADGARVRRRRLFRCGHLAGITEAAARFAELDITLICDLRRADERAEDPTAPALGRARRLEIPIDPGSAVQLREALAAGAVDLAARIRFMQNITRELARHHAGDYARMFEALLGHAPGGFLVHCTAGKDRTGVAAALILLALGVPREVVLEDYLLTNSVIDFERFILPRIRASLGHDDVDVDGARALSGVRPEYLEAAFAEIDAAGGVDDYLERALGLGPRQRAALRSHYLE